MLKIINNFITENQPNLKMELNDKLKNLLDFETYNKIRNRQTIILNNQKYIFNQNKNKYVKFA